MPEHSSHFFPREIKDVYQVYEHHEGIECREGVRDEPLSCIKAI